MSDRLTSPTKSSIARKNAPRSDTRDSPTERDLVAEKAKRKAKLKSSQAQSRLTSPTASSSSRARITQEDEARDTISSTRTSSASILRRASTAASRAIGLALNSNANGATRSPTVASTSQRTNNVSTRSPTSASSAPAAASASRRLARAVSTTGSVATPGKSTKSLATNEDIVDPKLAKRAPAAAAAAAKTAPTNSSSRYKANRDIADSSLAKRAAPGNTRGQSSVFATGQRKPHTAVAGRRSTASTSTSAARANTSSDEASKGSRPGATGSVPVASSAPSPGARSGASNSATTSTARAATSVARTATSRNNNAVRDGHYTSTGVSSTAATVRGSTEASDNDNDSVASGSSSDSSVYCGKPPKLDTVRSALFEMVCNSKWFDAIARVREFPDETKYIDRNGFNCLHIAVRLIPPIDFLPDRHRLRQLTVAEERLTQTKLLALREIIQARPEALSEPDSNLWTPMHVAVRAVAPEALTICAEASLEPFSMETILGLTPFQVLEKDADVSIKTYIKHTIAETEMTHEHELRNHVNEIWRKIKFCLYIHEYGAVPPNELGDDMRWALEVCAGWLGCTSTVFNFILVNSFQINNGRDRTIPQRSTSIMLNQIVSSFLEAHTEETRLLEASTTMGKLKCDDRDENVEPARLQVEFCGMTDEQHDVDRLTEIKFKLGEGPPICGWPIELDTRNAVRKAELFIARFPDCVIATSAESGEWALEVVGQRLNDDSSEELCQIVRLILIANPAAFAQIESVSVRVKVQMLSLLSTVWDGQEFQPDDLYNNTRYQAIRQMPQLVSSGF
jgi:hypothetical protein